MANVIKLHKGLDINLKGKPVEELFEVKAPDGKPTLIQCQKLKQINDTGGYAILLYPEKWHCFENFIWCIKYGDFRNADLNYEGILQPVWIEWLRKLKGQD